MKLHNKFFDFDLGKLNIFIVFNMRCFLVGWEAKFKRGPCAHDPLSKKLYLHLYIGPARIEFNYSLANASRTSGRAKRVLTDTFAVFQGYKPKPEEK